VVPVIEAADEADSAETARITAMIIIRRAASNFLGLPLSTPRVACRGRIKKTVAIFNAKIRAVPPDPPHPRRQ
jgi:hypothetical protein